MRSYVIDGLSTEKRWHTEKKKSKILNKLDETGLHLATTNRKLNVYGFIL